MTNITVWNTDLICLKGALWLSLLSGSGRKLQRQSITY